MTIKKYHRLKKGILIFLFIIFSLSLFLKIYFLSVISVLTAILFIALFHSSQALSDEREVAVRRQAVDFTFTILVSTLSLGSFIMFLPLSTGWSVFSKGEFLYVEAIGTIFAYLSISLIILYSLAYFIFNRKSGGNNEK
jgi:hypothetical protein